MTGLQGARGELLGTVGGSRACRRVTQEGLQSVDFAPTARHEVSGSSGPFPHFSQSATEFVHQPQTRLCVDDSGRRVGSLDSPWF